MYLKIVLDDSRSFRLEVSLFFSSFIKHIDAYGICENLESKFIGWLIAIRISSMPL